MKYHGISLRPFGQRQSLNRYAPPLQQCHSLFIPFLYPLRHLSPLRGQYLIYEERIGLTVFHIVNNTSALGALYRPRAVCPFVKGRMKLPQPCSVPFWFKRFSLFRLLIGDDPYNGSLYVLRSTLILTVCLF